ncbi:MAG TPA: LamG-like jellyroll fold domain-containing protein [Candidatus Paceibacterota bacterium]|nr:LamG-like jellyroll fold domain-containing protein [Candidatus Paceibacterota bacterium]
MTIKNVAIGASSVGLNNFFDGSIDDVRIYNRALSPEEVKRLYNMGR